MQEKRWKGEVRERENRCDSETGYEMTSLCFGIVELLSSSLDRAFLPAITAVSSQATAEVGAVTAVVVLTISGCGKGQDRTGQDRTGQDRTGQDRTGQDKTRQHTTAWPITRTASLCSNQCVNSVSIQTTGHTAQAALSCPRRTVILFSSFWSLFSTFFLIRENRTLK